MTLFKINILGLWPGLLGGAKCELVLSCTTTGFFLFLFRKYEVFLLAHSTLSFILPIIRDAACLSIIKRKQ